jgi:hypothetical protein
MYTSLIYNEDYPLKIACLSKLAKVVSTCSTYLPSNLIPCQPRLADELGYTDFSQSLDEI